MSRHQVLVLISFNVVLRLTFFHEGDDLELQELDYSEKEVEIITLVDFALELVRVG